jgi:AraC-like DNA-binding protein
MALVLDTRDVEAWRAGTAEAFFPMRIAPAPGTAFRARLVARELGPVAVGRVTAAPNACRRTRRDIARADPELLRVLVLRRGRTHVEQDGRACTVTRGDLVLYDSSRPFAVDAREACDLVVCGVPTALLGAQADRLRTLTATRIPAASSVARLLGGYAQAVADEPADAAGDAAQLDLADALLALVRGLARAQAPAAPRLRRVQAWMDAHLADPDLTPARIAAAHFLSVRALHRLFEAEGVTVSAWLRARRLEGCRRDLADPALAELTVAEVALRWGFRDPSRFGRRFREAYGSAPSAFRR